MSLRERLKAGVRRAGHRILDLVLPDPDEQREPHQPRARAADPSWEDSDYGYIDDDGQLEPSDTMNGENVRGYADAPDLNNPNEARPKPYVPDPKFLRMLELHHTDARAARGREKFQRLITLFILTHDFAKTTGRRPTVDMAQVLHESMGYGFDMLVFVHACGGLTRAIHELGLYSDYHVKERGLTPARSAFLLASDLAQIASVSFCDLSDLYTPIPPEDLT